MHHTGCAVSTVTTARCWQISASQVSTIFNGGPTTFADTSRQSGKLRRTSRRLVEALDDHRHALAAADAHRRQADGLVISLESIDQRAQDARAGHPERVPKCNCTTVWIELVAERI